MICYGYGTKLCPFTSGRGLNGEQTISSFRSLATSIESIYLVEASPALRDKQKQLLCGESPLEETGIGFRSTSKYSKIPITWCEDIRFIPDSAYPLTSRIGCIA